MFCISCGNQATDGARFCAVCGTPISGSGVRSPAQPTISTAAQPSFQSPNPSGVRTEARQVPTPPNSNSWVGVATRDRPPRAKLPVHSHADGLYAGFWLRFGAWLIDVLIMTCIASPIALIVPAMGGKPLSNAPITWVVVPILWLYYAIFESSKLQATPGKLVFKLSVTDLLGQRIGFGCATVRVFGRCLSTLILFFGYFMVGWTARKQGLHDMLAGTCVVRKSGLLRFEEGDTFATSASPLGMRALAIALIVLSAVLFWIIGQSAYHDYLIRSQVLEGMAIAGGAEAAVAQAYSDHGSFPTNNANAGLASAVLISGKYVSSVDVGVQPGVIEVTFSSHSPELADKLLDGKVLAFSAVSGGRNGQISWNCGTNLTTIPVKYLPTPCRHGGDGQARASAATVSVQPSMVVPASAGPQTEPSPPTSDTQSSPSITKPSAFAMTPQQIFAKDSPSIVVVKTYNATGQPLKLGSGVVIARGQVVTNCHVVKDGVTLQVMQGKVAYSASLHFSDTDRDLCQLSVPQLTAPPVSMGDAKTLQPGASVVAIGAPEGLELTISSGLVSSLRDFGDGTKIIQTSAAISPGSSGGGLFDDQGRLVGITAAFLKEGENLNFALPANWIAKLSNFSATAQTAETSAVDWLTTAAALEEKNDGEGLLDLARRWVNAQPKNAIGWGLVGEAYVDLNQYAVAQSALEQSIKLDPTIAATWSNLGVDYGHLQQYAAAKGADEQAVKLDPTIAGGWYNLGVADVDLQQYAAAKSAYEQAIKLDPTIADGWYNLGVVDAHLQQYAAARSAYEQAIKLEPTNADAWYNFGFICSIQGDRDGVIQAYQHLRRLDPSQADKLSNEVHLPN